MSKRWAWLLGVVVLVLIGVLVACGTGYNSSVDGLLLVGSQGSGVVESFSFNLATGGVSGISNTPVDTSDLVCVLKGVPSSIVVNPAGTYAYTIINQNSLCPGSKTGILAFELNPDGMIIQVGNLVGFRKPTVTVQNPKPGTATTVSPSVVPNMMTIDPAGKFLFIANRATTGCVVARSPNGACPTNPTSDTVFVPGSVSVFSLGSGGSVTEVTGSPFFTTTTPTTTLQSSIDIVSVAATPTVFPGIGINGVQGSVCSIPGSNPPKSEYLYAVDDLGYQVFEFQVNTSSGVLTNPSSLTQAPAFATGQIPEGVAVDPCDRFVYVSDSQSNQVSAYTICNGYVTQSQSCTSPTAMPPGALVQISGSPFSISPSNGPGPILVDPFGNYVYVVGTLSNTVSPLKISPISGSLTALPTPTVATGPLPSSIAIRGDDSWLFVANSGFQTVSQYSVTPQTGVLTAEPPIYTDNYPVGVAVK